MVTGMRQHERGPRCRSGRAASTPMAAEAIDLLGPGAVDHGVAISRDEFAEIGALYGAGSDGVAHPLAPEGGDRNLLRQARHDGLRILAWVARFVPPGTDPLATVVQAFVDAKFEVPQGEAEWACGDDGEEDDDATGQ